MSHHQNRPKMNSSTASKSRSRRLSNLSLIPALGLLTALPRLHAVDYDGGISMSNPQWLTETIRNKEIDAVRHAADRIRLPINWDELQPSDATSVADWNWDVFDDIIARARPADGTKKLNVLIILGAVPGWANGNGGYGKPATDPAKYQKYCREVAKRYLSLGVSTYQIGNEVNLIHPGWAAPDGGDYYTNFVLPGATGVWEAAVHHSLDYNVVLGSLAPNTWNIASPHPVTFLEAFYLTAPANKRWLWGSLAYHPYVGPGANPPSSDGNLGTIPEDLYDIMVANGEGTKQLWATEFGTPTHGGIHVTDEDDVPDWVDDVLATWYSYSFAGPLFWYTARDKQAYGASTDRENYFGLLYSDFSAKPAYPVLKACFSPTIENGRYQVIARHSAKALDVDNWGTSNGTQVQQWTWHAGASQQWTFEKQTDGLYEIKTHVATGMNLHLANSSSGTSLAIWQDNNGTGQRFQLTSLDNGFYRITPRINTSYALDVSAASTADGADVLQYPWFSTSFNQQWMIVPLF